MRQMGLGAKGFKIDSKISFPIDIAARRAFRMFSEVDPDMRLEIERFVQLSKGKECFLDVGSLFGIFSLTFTSNNQESTAFAIEPSAKCFKVLEHNLALNKSKLIKATQLAFGQEQGVLDMHYEWVHLIANHNMDAHGVQAKMTTIDQFVASQGIKPDIIKIDVDGYEGPVISGAKEFLSNYDPIIFLELHGEWIERYGHTPISIADTLKCHGYNFFDLHLKPIQNIEEVFSIFAKRIICTKDPNIISG